MFGLGYPEWICIFLIVLLVFGGRKLPEVARGLAKAIHEFRKARDELHDTVKKQMEDSQTSPDTDPRESSGQDADRSDGDRVKTPPKD